MSRPISSGKSWPGREVEAASLECGMSVCGAARRRPRARCDAAWGGSGSRLGGAARFSDGEDERPGERSRAGMRGGEPPGLLDAKGRDLREKSLPQEMPYQLVVDAISQPARPGAAILRPTANPTAREARIDAADPLSGRPLGQVCLRPVNLERIEALVASPTAFTRRDRTALARRLVFGEAGGGTPQNPDPSDS